jgi:hypothetical protein
LAIIDENDGTRTGSIGQRSSVLSQLKVQKNLQIEADANIELHGNSIEESDLHN